MRTTEQSYTDGINFSSHLFWFYNLTFYNVTFYNLTFYNLMFYNLTFYTNVYLVVKS